MKIKYGLDRLYQEKEIEEKKSIKEGKSTSNRRLRHINALPHDASRAPRWLRGVDGSLPLLDGVHFCALRREPYAARS